MTIISLKCNCCGANLEVDKERTTCFCSYCGHKILFEKDKKEITHWIVNEAKLKELDLAEKVINMKAQQNQKRTQKIFSIKISLFLIWIAIIIILYIVSINTSDIAGFSPYHLILIPTLILGIKLIIDEVKKFFKNN